LTLWCGMITFGNQSGQIFIAIVALAKKDCFKGLVYFLIVLKKCINADNRLDASTHCRAIKFNHPKQIGAISQRYGWHIMNCCMFNQWLYAANAVSH
ncbi:MAG: hypothetical protein R3240_07945, partial [Gammaproteobacteria bacterium]|nr:hypothetical protein [Gammaproteobacteria bacterium]